VRRTRKFGSKACNPRLSFRSSPEAHQGFNRQDFALLAEHTSREFPLMLFAGTERGTRIGGELRARLGEQARFGVQVSCFTRGLSDC